MDTMHLLEIMIWKIHSPLLIFTVYWSLDPAPGMDSNRDVSFGAYMLETEQTRQKGDRSLSSQVLWGKQIRAVVEKKNASAGSYL